MPEDTQDHFDFDESMQVGLLRRLCNVGFFERHFDTVSPEHFDGEVLPFIARVLLAWQRKYHAELTREVLTEEISRSLKSGRRVPIEAKVREVVDTMYGKAAKIPEKYIETRFVEWIRHQLFGRALIEATELHGQKRYADARRRIDDAYFSTDGYDLGYKFFDGAQDRTERRMRQGSEKIPTLILQLDDMLRGGLTRKTFAVIMGHPKKGKSFCLLNIAKGAIIMGYKVTYYTLESGMPEAAVADRFDACFSGIKMEDLKDAPERVVAAIEKAKQNYTGSLVIKEYAPASATVDTIEAHQKKLTATGFQSDLIIVDYADMLKSSAHYEQRWIELTEVFKELSGLTSRSNIVMWAASGVHRTPKSQKTHGMLDAGGAFDKMFVADVIITLNQDEKEKKEKKMRIFLAAARGLPDGIVKTITTDFDHAQFAKPEAFDDDEFAGRKDLF